MIRIWVGTGQETGLGARGDTTYPCNNAALEFRRYLLKPVCMEAQGMILKLLRSRPLEIYLGSVLLALVAATLLSRALDAPVRAADKPGGSVAANWDRQGAARYLDGREVYWQGWDRAQKDHGTLCVSCHTQATYALARPELRSPLGENGLTEPEKVMLASVEKRVTMWKDAAPFYADATSGAGKEVESRDAESVLNAIILTGYDQRLGHLRDVTRLAYDNAWALQSKTGPDAGAWVWQNFHYTPWESPESQYHFAAMLAMAIGKAPDHYRDDPKIAANLSLLTSYLNSHYEAQPLLNKTVAFWASFWFPSVLNEQQRASWFEQVYQRQRVDGGWSLTELGAWKRVDDTPLETRADGYATGLITLVLEETEVSPQTNPHVIRGLEWLAANQDKTTGAWPAWSLNKSRDPKTNAGKFMSDAATSYAVMALSERR